MPKKRIPVAILGTGNIGTDLCARLLRDSDFEVVAIVGRRIDSPGLKFFEGKVRNIIPNGLTGLPILPMNSWVFLMPHRPLIIWGTGRHSKNGVNG